MITSASIMTAPAASISDRRNTALSVRVLLGARGALTSDFLVVSELQAIIQPVSAGRRHGRDASTSPPIMAMNTTITWPRIELRVA